MAIPSRPSRQPITQSGLTPRPADRLPLVIAGIVVVVALAFAGTLLVSVLRGFGSGDQPGTQLTAQQPAASNTGPAAVAPPAVVAAGTASAAAPTPASTNSSLAVSDQGTSTLGQPYVVCLDVGHGGMDWGYTRTDPDSGELIAKESDINLEIANAIKDRLETQGVEVVLTRTDDELVNPTGLDVNGDGEKATDGDGDGLIDTMGQDGPDNLDELQARVNVCNDANADLLISIHINGAENTSLQGYESWWAEGRPDSDKSKWFAQEVVSQFGEQFDAAGFDVQSRGAQDDNETDIPAKDLPTNEFSHYVVLSPDVPDRDFIGSTMPGAVVESLFLSNDNDWAVLSDPTGLDAIVNAYVSSINGFFTEFPIEGKRLSTGESHSGHSAGTPLGTPGAVAGAPTEISMATPAAYPRLPPPAQTDAESSYLVETADTTRDEVALTFDCGADRGNTEAILDTLDRYGLKGSFGMTGLWAEDNPDLVLRMAREGHMIFNHTYSHQSFTGFSTDSGDPGTDFRINEIEQTEQVVSEITGGYDMAPYWRPPYGDVGPQTLKDMASIGYGITVMWTVDTLGWNGMSGPNVLERCMDSLQPGEIVLMHVGVQAPGDFAALEPFIEQAEAQGYSFVTVDQLMQP